MTAKPTRARTYALFEKRFRPIARKDGTLIWNLGELPDHAPGNCRSWWTLLDCDGKLYLAAGFRYVNRIGYIRCEVPWTGQDRLTDYRYA